MGGPRDLAAYFAVHAAFQRAAEGGSGRAAIARAGERAGLSRRELDAVLATEEVGLWPALTQLRASTLRFTLIADCLRAAVSAGHALPGELAPLRRIAAALAILPDQLVAIATYALASAHAEPDRLRSALAQVEASGVPAAAVAGLPGSPPPLGYAALAHACDRLFERG